MLSKEVFQDGGAKARGVAAEEDETGPVGKELGDEAECIEKGVLDFVELPALTPPEGGRVQENRVVGATATDFPLEELVAIVDDPPDGVVLQVVQGGVFPCPLDHTSSRVDVAAVGPVPGGREGCGSGVGEEVEEAGGCRPRFCSPPEPMADRLPEISGLGEDAEMAEIRGGQFQADAVDGDLPAVREGVPAPPLEAAFPGEKGVRPRPALGMADVPDGLGTRAVEHDRAEAFEFAAPAAVEEGVFVFWHLRSLSVFGMRAAVAILEISGRSRCALAVWATEAQASGMHAFLILTISGKDRPGLVEALAEVVAAHEGNWEHCRMAHLADRFVGLLQVSVPEGRRGLLEQALGSIEDLVVTVAPGAPVESAPVQQFDLEIVGSDHPGIVRDVFKALAAASVNVEELSTRTVTAADSGAILFEAKARLACETGVERERVRAELERIAQGVMVEIRLID